MLAEIASGSARKARIVLGALEAPAAYVPVDISEETLSGEADALRCDFPGLRVLPVAVDFSGDFAFPGFPFDHGRIAIFYAGSSLGNFEPEEGAAFLARLGRAAGPGSRLLLGVDRKKDKATLDRAYNDPGGLNAAFNRNILNNVNTAGGRRLQPGAVDPRQPSTTSGRAASSCGWRAPWIRRSGWPVRPCASPPATGSTPRTPTSTRSKRSWNWPPRPGAPSTTGPTRTNGSASFLFSC